MVKIMGHNLQFGYPNRNFACIFNLNVLTFKADDFRFNL